MKGSGDRIWEQKRSRSGMVVSAKWARFLDRIGKRCNEGALVSPSASVNSTACVPLSD